MAELLGIIAPIKKFLSNSDEDIFFSINGEKQIVCSLAKNRIYRIPDFQREIRWSCDNVAMLIEDIKTKPRFLGNVILTKHSDNSFSIIDGQQRITILTMILSAINKYHGQEIETICPCKLIIESFTGLTNVLQAYFDVTLYTKEMFATDKLKQFHKYKELWDFIIDSDEIKYRKKAKEFVDNLGECTFNIVINESDDVGEGIRYFIDVNLKGKQLDIEDIFKSFLFKNDSGKEIREQWYLLKATSAEIESSKMDYPILKLLEHYFLCDLYRNNNYKGMEFGTDFFLKKQYKEDGVIYRAGTHLIELINDKSYMKNSLIHLNEISHLMLQIVNSDSITSEIKDIFSGQNEKKNLDDIELKVIHNIIGKILKDTNILPKALLIKYFGGLLFGESGKSKSNIRKIYGIYLFSVLFSLFENKKSTDVLIHILKGNDTEWYKELVDQIEDYFTDERITDARLLAQYKFGRNEKEEDHRFRCKSLATIYNYFINTEGQVKIRNGKMNNLYKFITNDETFSIEHFIISESKNRVILVQDDKQYTVNETIYKRYVNNFFNFIFIERETNSLLGNNWLPKKMEILKDKKIECEYSKMIVGNLSKLEKEFEKRGGDNYKDNLDLFFTRDYKDVYIEYTRSVLKNIIDRINSYKKQIEKLG